MDRFGLFNETFRGLSSSTTAEHRYPYDKPSETTANRGGAASTSGQSPKPARQHRYRPIDIEETMHTLINHLRHNRHMKQIWEVAVKRNAMTTSLALLGGVLLADVYIYPEKKSRAQHAVLRAKLGPAGTTAAAVAATAVQGHRETAVHHATSVLVQLPRPLHMFDVVQLHVHRAMLWAVANPAS